LTQHKNRQEQIEQVVVTAQQMREIEGRIFEAGMPVAALMEKVAGLIARSYSGRFIPSSQTPRVGVLAGPGHNGGDALVVARELHLQGYNVLIYRPITKLKELTANHAQYAASLGIPLYEQISPLYQCDLIIDGLFGFGLTRALEGNIADAINQLNQWSQPVISIDLPSGLHTDTGEVLGTAVRATRTFCLGLWKLAFLQDQALEYIGEAELIDFDIPAMDVWSILGSACWHSTHDTIGGKRAVAFASSSGNAQVQAGASATDLRLSEVFGRGNSNGIGSACQWGRDALNCRARNAETATGQSVTRGANYWLPGD
jgi:NAD(P)H-hydrate epimerase